MKPSRGMEKGRASMTGNMISFDIETGPCPWEEIEQFYEPPEPLPEWDENMVAYGNLKDPVKRSEKRGKVLADYLAKVDRFDADCQQHKEDWINRAALSPLTGQVLAIGSVAGLDMPVEIYGGCNMTEGSILECFWAAYARVVSEGGKLIGWNIFGFDLPFLIVRSWKLDVDVPEGIMVNKRYWSPLFIDLMVEFACGTRSMTKLDVAARFFGVGGKPDGVDGGAFAGLWNNPETRPQAIEYLNNDVYMTAAVARKMGIC